MHTGSMVQKSRAGEGRRRRFGITAVVVVATIAVETVMMRKRGYRVGLNTVVRCRSGHVFSTIWIPGASLKAVRLGIVRLQYCPVGRHFTAVRPLTEAELAAEGQSVEWLPHDVLLP